MTMESDGAIKCYLDGLLLGDSTSGSTAFPELKGMVDLTLHDMTAFWHSGLNFGVYSLKYGDAMTQVGDVRVYQKALTSAELIRLNDGSKWKNGNYIKQCFKKVRCHTISVYPKPYQAVSRKSTLPQKIHIP